MIINKKKYKLEPVK